jgi:predicted phosphoribosyltransferase
MYLRDRIDAGGRLAHALVKQCGHLNGAVVLALPRGGVPVAEEVVKALKHAELDVLIVRKIGAPGYPEYGIGALAEGGYIHINQAAAAATGATAGQIQAVVEDETRELNRRVQTYRNGEPYRSVAGRPTVIVDDGLATGKSFRGRCEWGSSNDIHMVAMAPSDTCIQPMIAVSRLANQGTCLNFQNIGAV